MAVMEPALILADRIIQVIRDSGADSAEASCALSIADRILPSLHGIPEPPLPPIQPIRADDPHAL